jgi:hypothetical protein
MKIGWLMAMAGMLCGCDYTVQMTKSPSVRIDPALVGAWERDRDDGTSEHLVILPLGLREYLVSFPAHTSDSLFGRACLWRLEGHTFLQIEWIGTARGLMPADRRVYQYASFAASPEALSFSLFNPAVIPDAPPDEFAASITRNRGRPDRFRDSMAFRRSRFETPPNAPDF